MVTPWICLLCCSSSTLSYWPQGPHHKNAFPFYLENWSQLTQNTRLNHHFQKSGEMLILFLYGTLMVKTFITPELKCSSSMLVAQFLDLLSSKYCTQKMNSFLLSQCSSYISAQCCSFVTISARTEWRSTILVIQNPEKPSDRHNIRTKPI